MSRLWQDAVVAQTADEQLGVTYTSVPKGSTAKARGEAALSSAKSSSPASIPPVPIKAKSLSPPPKQPPPKPSAPSQGSTPMTSANPKGKTRRGGQWKRIQRKAQKEAHHQGLCNHVDAAIQETDQGSAVNLHNRNNVLRHIDNIDATVAAAEAYNQSILQYIETVEEEETLFTEFEPAVDVLARCLRNDDGSFVVNDNMTITMPMQRFTRTRMLDITATLRTSIERENRERVNQINKHGDTLARVSILIAALRQAKNTLNQTVAASMEVERRYNNLRNTLEALFDDPSSESESEEQQEGPPFPSTHRYWDNLHANALSPSGDESEHSWPSSDGGNHRRSRAPGQSSSHATSSQAAPKAAAKAKSSNHGEPVFDESFKRAENLLLGIFDTDDEVNDTDPEEPHPNTVARSYRPDSD